jgi:PhnB protein
MTTVNPYLLFQGNCEEAFQFYKSVFQSDFRYMGRFSETPPQDTGQFPPGMENKIMHVSLPISEETILMGCDNPDPNSKSGGANNISLTLNTDSKQEADRLHNGLSKGGQVRMPMQSTFWGAYFGMLTDKFGITWMISCDQPNA